ncbi:MAG TPA: histidine kinase [Bryobacteraceae bacterium]|nr:histidine kinase [Bryobacteraceae bacterium]
MDGSAAPSGARRPLAAPPVFGKQTAKKNLSARLAELARRLLEAQDRDREKIARRLHDDLGQQVAAISILLSALKRRLCPVDIEILEPMERALQKVVDLGVSLRDLSSELHSSVLEHAGIEAALRAHCSELSSRAGAQISFESSGDFEDLRPEAARGVYRIAKEALKDSAAANVRLFRSGAALHLAIQSGAIACLAPVELELLRQRGKAVGAAVRRKGSQLTVSIPRIC